MSAIQPAQSGNLANMQAAIRQGLDPVAFAREVLNFRPDPWQESVLRSTAKQVLICCSRQSGKSTIAGVASLHMANYNPGSLTLMLSPTQRQSTELLAKASTFLRRLSGAKLDNESSIAIKFADGSRLVSLPGTDPDRIRGFSSPALVIIDEAAFVDDRLYYAIRPMLAVGGGRLIVMSTPNGKRGWFHDAWHFDADDDWQRERVTAHEVPRITADFLAKERKRIGDRWFRQEYLCEFISSDEELFSGEDIERAVMAEVFAFNHTIGI
jgi:hypothetical protein